MTTVINNLTKTLRHNLTLIRTLKTKEVATRDLSFECIRIYTTTLHEHK